MTISNSTNRSKKRAQGTVFFFFIYLLTVIRLGKHPLRVQAIINVIHKNCINSIWKHTYFSLSPQSYNKKFMIINIIKKEHNSQIIHPFP